MAFLESGLKVETETLWQPWYFRWHFSWFLGQLVGSQYSNPISHRTLNKKYESKISRIIPAVHRFNCAIK